MKIVIISIGTQGDVRPLVALGIGLKKLGHQVCLVCNIKFQPLVESAGLDFSLIDADFLELMATNPEQLKKGKSILTIFKVARRGILNMADQWATQGIHAAKGADLLIGSGMSVPIVSSLSELLDIPFAISHLQPMTPTRKIPAMGLPLPKDKGSEWYNLASHHVFRFIGWHILRPAINTKLRKQLGLKPYPLHSPYYLPAIKHKPILYGYSQHLLPSPKDWQANIAVSGFWFYDQAASWQPPKYLEDFLNNGSKPIYVGFGSMLNGNAAELTEKIITAIRLSGQRAILASGWGGLSTEQISGLEKQICLIDNAPHDWLFPRVSMAIHHGGAGTTAAAARAGIPSIIVPFLADQPFWAWCLKRLGVSPGSLDQKNFSVTQLVRYIEDANSAAIQQNASQLGQKIRAENGVENAILALKEFGYLH
ncbi:glycosyltransferase [Marinomonas sp. THO17]|uniref:glycosyltransferase n=1 Tax=Marinomonas sp. THO17 TaxID=3149048 RepID=UPI00336BFCBF